MLLCAMLTALISLNSAAAALLPMVVLGQVISNTATALVMIPIATPANMMVMGPGGYRFGDYWKLGLPVMCWFLIVSLTVIPVVWPF
jgi:di/tricarboxylate transporter